MIELWRRAMEILFLPVTTLVNQVTDMGMFPSIWRDGWVCWLRKHKGDGTKTNEYRSVVFLDHLGKGWIGQQARRLTRSFSRTAPATFFGYLKRRSGTQAILVLEEVCRRFMQRRRVTVPPHLRNRHLAILFLDLTQAFDRAERQAIWAAIEQAGSPRGR